MNLYTKDVSESITSVIPREIVEIIMMYYALDRGPIWTIYRHIPEFIAKQFILNYNMWAVILIRNHKCYILLCNIRGRISIYEDTTDICINNYKNAIHIANCSHSGYYPIIPDDTIGACLTQIVSNIPMLMFDLNSFYEERQHPDAILLGALKGKILPLVFRYAQHCDTSYLSYLFSIDNTKLVEYVLAQSKILFSLMTRSIQRSCLAEAVFHSCVGNVTYILNHISVVYSKAIVRLKNITQASIVAYGTDDEFHKMRTGPQVRRRFGDARIIESLQKRYDYQRIR